MKAWGGKAVKVCRSPFSPLIADYPRTARTISNNNTVCCIYHPPKASIDDSSDESSSDSSSDSDSDDGSARLAGGKRRADARHKHNHDPSGECHHDGKTKKSRRSRSPNAYEKIPKPKESGPA